MKNKRGLLDSIYHLVWPHGLPDSTMQGLLCLGLMIFGCIAGTILMVVLVGLWTLWEGDKLF